MRKETLAAVAALVSVTVFAAEGVKPRVNRGELRRQSQMRQFGGLVMSPTSFRGRIVFADASGRCAKEIGQTIKGLQRQLNVNMASLPCEKPTLANIPSLQKSINAEGVVFVTDDPALPPLLTAPESRWSLVNVAGLADGVSEEVASRRIRCELARGYSYLAGAASSSYENAVMTAITSPDQLDKVAEELPPVEVVARFQTYLERLGVTPKLMVPYRQACQEGWAHQPTNGYQKAIWDKVHEIPAKPIKIEYNEKRDKGK